MRGGKNNHRKSKDHKNTISATPRNAKQAIDHIQQEANKLEIRTEMIKQVTENILQESVPKIKKQAEEIGSELEEIGNKETEEKKTN
jgi:archaellum component FlaC